MTAAGSRPGRCRRAAGYMIRHSDVRPRRHCDSCGLGATASPRSRGRLARSGIHHGHDRVRHCAQDRLAWPPRDRESLVLAGACEHQEVGQSGEELAA